MAVALNQIGTSELLDWFAVLRQLLMLYRQILQQGEIAANDTSEQMGLRLSGLVVQRDGKLKVYNPIYQAVFNHAWVDQALATIGME